jgi:transcriptional regulator with XRE-family HTH domain
MGLSVGRKISALRLAKGWTGAQLADLVGVTEATVSRWETVRFNPDRETFEKVVEVLDVHPGYLSDKGVAELDDLKPAEVAIHESFRMFLEELSPASRRRAEHYRNGLDIPIAPRTREGWRQLHAFLEATRRRT